MIFRMLSALARSSVGLIRSAPAIAKSAWGTGGFGLLLGKTGLKTRLGIAGLIGGTYLIGKGAHSLLTAPYSMDPEQVAWGYTPGMTAPYENFTMNFSKRNFTSQDIGATGATAFALHNLRKR